MWLELASGTGKGAPTPAKRTSNSRSRPGRHELSHKPEAQDETANAANGIKRRPVIAAAGSLLAAPAVVRARAQAGVALVIGNSKYKWEASARGSFETLLGVELIETCRP